MSITRILNNAANAMLKDDKEGVGLVLLVLNQIYKQEGSNQIDKGNDG
jgi:hypothetical protein